MERALIFFVIYFLRVERDLVFYVTFFRVWNTLWYFMLYFPECGTRFGILCCIFPRVERALLFCVYIFISACGTRSGILWCIFLRVECALVFCVILLCVWNTL